MSRVGEILVHSRYAYLMLSNAMIFQQVLAERDARVTPLERATASPNVADAFLDAWGLILAEIDAWGLILAEIDAGGLILAEVDAEVGYTPMLATCGLTLHEAFQIARIIVKELAGNAGFDDALRQLATMTARRNTARLAEPEAVAAARRIIDRRADPEPNEREGLIRVLAEMMLAGALGAHVGGSVVNCQTGDTKGGKMVDTRVSSSGKYVLDIETDPMQRLMNKYAFASKVSEIRERLSGKVVTAPGQLHEHYGATPPEAADKAFAEADKALSSN